MGKYLARWYEWSFDAQKIHELLQLYATISTQSTIDTKKLLSYKISTKLDKT